MFSWLGNFIVRFWLAILLVWIGALVAGWALAPRWEDVTSNSEVQFLPPGADSRRADALFEKSFLEFSPGNVALVFAREQGELTEADRTFVRDEIRGKSANPDKKTPATGLMKISDDLLETYDKSGRGDDFPITTILTLDDEKAGALLVSPDKKATVVLIEIKSPFQDLRNVELIAKVEALIAGLRTQGKIPAGLEVGVAGSATAGRDLDQAEADGAKAIERWTIAIVVLLLIFLYRAPLVAIIPLLTVFVSVEVAMHFLSLLAKYKVFAPPRDLRVFVTVLSYGAGVDYCLFLVARYREELDNGFAPAEALAHTIGRVGGAITASAAVVIGGIGMLAFARFGKLHYAGLVIPLALTVALLGTLTFAGSLLRLAGPWAFWPLRIVPKGSPQPPPSAWRWLVDASSIPNIWDRIGPLLVRWPGTIFIGTNLLLAPFVVFGILHAHEQNYNPLTDLPSNAPSRRGMAVLQRHIPIGVLGPVTVLVKNDAIDFADPKWTPAVSKLTDRLRDDMKKLGLEDVRSLAAPLGFSEAAKAKWASVRDKKSLDEEVRAQALDHYVGARNPHVMRLELTLDDDPLSRTGIEKLSSIRDKLPDMLPDELRGSTLEFAGSTASLRDLSTIKQGDQDLVQILVSVIVFVMLLIVLRRVVVSVYLVVSVLLSYVATMGMTDFLFRHVTGLAPAGLDWKVPIFLFTILVAVGEDYNIFLLTRVKEEQDDFGPMDAIPHALSRTGQVITSCGLVMAGTFASLLSGSLLAMKELGFALAVGVLVDTMIVRPILVPTFLVLLQKIFPGRVGEFMALGRWPRDLPKDAR